MSRPTQQQQRTLPKSLLRQQRQTTRARAGLTLSPSRVRKQLVAGYYAPRISNNAAVYLTAVVEYVAAEAIELGGNATVDGKRKRITPRDLLLGLRNDEELNALLKDVTLPGAGALPNIHARLLPADTKKEKKLLTQAEGY